MTRNNAGRVKRAAVAISEFEYKYRQDAKEIKNSITSREFMMYRFLERFLGKRVLKFY